MNQSLIFSLLALAALVPAVLLPLRGEKSSRDGFFWAVLALAWAGPFLWAGYAMSGVWKSGLSLALWVSIASSLSVFAVVAVSQREAWRLTPLFSPYMMAMGVFATVFWQTGNDPAAVIGHGANNDEGAGRWLSAHIIVSVLTYALVTVSAVGAFGAFLQERALKNKRPTRLTHMLPSVTDCEEISVRMLLWGEIVLGVDLATGMGARYMETGSPLAFDHKTVLSLAAFALIGALLFAHHRTGMRGRRAARLILLAYLLLSLGYIGVKLVTGVLMA